MIKYSRQDRLLTYIVGGEKINVYVWIQWPSYDFIFGTPHKSSKHYGVEAGFFQYRDTRRKKTKAGFYVDKQELRCLVNGFQKLERHCFVR